MKNPLFLILFSFVFIFFVVNIRNVSAQLATECYDGSWVQPTCNPVTSDPNACGILPPLFSGANCDQHTGYLRVQDESDVGDQGTWAQLYPGAILLGGVVGGWPASVPGGLVEAYGPIISGAFSANPFYRGAGDISALSDIYSGGYLRVVNQSNFSGAMAVGASPAQVSGFAGAAVLYVKNSAAFGNISPSLTIEQISGSQGPMLYFDNAYEEIPTKSNDVYFDYRGFLNAKADFEIQIDADNNSNADDEFRINNGADSPIFIVYESGQVNVTEDLDVSKNLTAGTVTSGGGTGAIWGDFLQTTGISCRNIGGTDDYVMFYEKATNRWLCRNVNALGIAVPTLLQVLQAGSDASGYTGNTIIGSSGFGYFDFHGNGSSFYVNDFTIDAEATGNANLAIKAQGGSTYLNLEAQQDASIYLKADTDNITETDNPFIKFSQDGGGNTAILGMVSTGRDPEGNLYTGTLDNAVLLADLSSDELQLGAGGSVRVTIEPGGDVGIGINNPADKLHIYDATYPSLTIAGPAGSGQLALATALGLYSNIAQANDFVLRSNTADLILSARNTSGDIRFATNNADLERMTITSAGNVGIGATAPAEKVEIGDTSAGTARLRITDTGQNAEVQLKYSSVANAHWALYTANTVDDSFRIWGNSADRMIISQAGTIRGNFADYNGNACAAGQLLVYSANGWTCADTSSVAVTPGGANTQVQYNNNGVLAGASSLIYNNSTNRVGIGIANPGSKLDIAGGDIRLADTAGETPYTIKSYANANSLWFMSPTPNLVLADAISWDRSVGIGYSAGTTGAGAGVLSIGQTSKNAATYTHGITNFYTNGLNRMSLIANGNVGIGTTNPGDKLEVNGSILVTPPYQVKAGSGGFGFTAAADSWTGFDLTGTNKRIILGVTGGQTRNVFDIERTDTWEHLMELRADGGAYFGGRVGIGPTPAFTPSASLHIRNTAVTPDIRLEGNATARYPNISFYNGSTKRAQIISDVGNGSYLMDYSASAGGTFRVRSTPDDNNATVLLINNSGNVGIGNVNPPSKLAVTAPTNVEGIRIISSNYSPLVIRNTANTADLFRVNQSGNVTANGTIVGNFAAYNDVTCTNGQVLIKNASNNWVCGTASGSDNLGNHTATQNLNMVTYDIYGSTGSATDDGNFDISGVDTITTNKINVNKINVNTIDPIYTIKGEKYATYVSGMTGVKEETTGLWNLAYDKVSGLAKLKLDFDKLEKGSDIWLFAQTINYTENFDKIVLLLTPSFDGRVWYEKDPSAHTFIIIGKPINVLSKDYEVSYRLTGPRFDYESWGNTTDEDTEGLIIE